MERHFRTKMTTEPEAKRPRLLADDHQNDRANISTSTDHFDNGKPRMMLNTIPSISRDPLPSTTLGSLLSVTRFLESWIM